jgi:uncharacterized protein (DUF1684 family)
MKRNTIVALLIVAVLAVIIVTSLTSGEQREAYMDRIAQEREEKDRDMRIAEDSPFAPDSVEYKGLNYFPVDMAYKIKAKLEVIPNKKIVTLPTSEGDQKQYLEFAYAIFDLHDKVNKLLILETVGGEFDGMLFLAFGDATSAYETYGAGRYLELVKAGERSITIDFNQAYNPYCAYTDGFSCPFPPKENLLEVPIRAGEMNYEE